MDHSSLLDALARESDRFVDVLADCDPGARVPACPDWTASDLLSHLLGVQWFWEQVVRGRPGEPADDLSDRRPPRPERHHDLVAAFREQTASFRTLLASCDPAEPAWHWQPAARTVGGTYRRQAHEALVHRLDAEQTAGCVTPFDPALAADGVLEALDWMYGGEPPEGHGFEPAGGLLEVRCTDTGDVVLVEPGRLSGPRHKGAHLVVRSSGSSSSPAATVSAPAGDLDAWLWHREGDERVSTSGDEAVLAAFRAAVSPPLD